MDETTKVFWLMQCLKHTPGFSYRPSGMFEYWGLPLDEIPERVFDLADHDYRPFVVEVETGLTAALAQQVVRNVDRFLAERHMKTVVD